MANNQNPSSIQELLTKVYGILKFAPDEIRGALNDLAGIQQIAVFNELLKSLTEGEVAQLKADFEAKSEDEKKTIIEGIAKAHSADPGFVAGVQAAAKRVLDEHVAYLKTRGDDGQKRQISQILEEII